MQHSIDPMRLTRPPRACLLAISALLCGVMVAGCGGSTPSSKASAPGSANISSSNAGAGSGAASSGLPSQAALESDELAFARCMRSSGVPNFPDPSPGGGFRVPAPVAGGRSSPAFQAAQAKCHKLLPGGGFPAAGTNTHPSARALAQMLKVAQCMRKHGISQFPDPATSIPSHPAGVGEIADRDGVILVIPASIDQQSPAYTQAAAACGFPLHK